MEECRRRYFEIMNTATPVLLLANSTYLLISRTSAPFVGLKQLRLDQLPSYNIEQEKRNDLNTTENAQN